MDNRYEHEINEPFFNESYNVREPSWGMPSTTRNSRTRFNHTRQTATSGDIRPLFEFMSEYNENIRVYQSNIRQYQETIHTFLNIVNSRNRAAQNTSPPNNQRHFAPASHAHRFTNLNSVYTNIVNDTILRHIDRIFPSLNEDVVVRPTPAQFTNATRIFQYSDGENNIDTHCPITLEEFNHEDMVCQIRHCGHCFKEDAIRNWFRQKVRCPVCRYDIRDYVDQERQEPSDNENSSRPIDISNNEVPLEEPPRRASQMDILVQNLSNGLSNIVQNYLDEGNNSTNNDILTFEFPIVFYNDASGNGFRFQNSR
jgi:hypothetical protein